MDMLHKGTFFFQIFYEVSADTFAKGEGSDSNLSHSSRRLLFFRSLSLLFNPPPPSPHPPLALYFSDKKCSESREDIQNQSNHCSTLSLFSPLSAPQLPTLLTNFFFEPFTHLIFTQTQPTLPKSSVLFFS